MPSGGSRAGAGRKPKAEKYERPINRAEKQIVDHLPDLIDNLLELASGGYERIEEHLEPAGLVFVGTGETQSLAFPHLDPTELVVVKRTRSYADHDRAANQYLVDRILGKPTAALEVSGRDGGPIEVEDSGLSDEARAERIARVLDRIRGRSASPPSAVT